LAYVDDDGFTAELFQKVAAELAPWEKLIEEALKPMKKVKNVR